MAGLCRADALFAGQDALDEVAVVAAFDLVGLLRPAVVGLADPVRVGRLDAAAVDVDPAVFTDPLRAHVAVVLAHLVAVGERDRVALLVGGDHLVVDRVVIHPLLRVAELARLDQSPWSSLAGIPRGH